ncbi:MULTISPECIES: hypothetical protein [unclassified Variovorax]|uniref:hypothetical protein n=1 Tax=unclassified Variovorax TaxID=663243 RepID=UPI00076D3D0D|nr:MULTISPECIES: hypothetical protein [unclassified Variovorax]KWT95585.1 hypothetical protein APY03_2462 [Variovorax sp. WDL1]PNG50197.1 hypothetical protein CHC06_05820 [Variovorax sp. B2]PNG51070.1 hypothetical protein CHC07_05726 [Variovorax sp. B4]VTU42300.1 hypothetical protein SRS16P1_00235 [Variovorax sp. SRS16]VTU42325.1 hypothetical protein E5P1_00233 [Variovorax sp. PBL-E5]
MIDARTIEERIAELAHQAGLRYVDATMPGARVVQMPGFLVRFGGLDAPECDGFKQARFVRLVATQFRRPFRLRRDRTLDYPAYGACFEPLSDKKILAEVKRWALATSWKDRHIRRLPLPQSVRKSLLAELELALQA